ncbi:hypothetical protein LJC74_03375 [Eubacteriales bacterium OttesenSCG-928-A19]|nr:hypothetical protein [Eubacteriales bacterium OttesenSCG-928-A19]
MKMARILLAACVLFACCAPAYATDMPAAIPGAMSTDAGIFSEIAQSVSWQIPGGYTLETYLRGDLSNDGYEDSIVASLRSTDGVHRMLVVIIANPASRHVYTSMTALPATTAGVDGTDPFLGFSSQNGYFTIHTGGTESGARYTFGLHGQHFYLDMVHADTWNADNAAMERFNELDLGNFVEHSGRMEQGAFIAESTIVEHTYDPHTSIFTLEEFDISTFPLEWEAFSRMIADRARPTPTKNVTPRPRPTADPTGMPGPLPWPTEGPMPGPVYPTDMPGPVYPTDMPGPVYPTDMPGPVYPTETPGPLEIVAE